MFSLEDVKKTDPQIAEVIMQEIGRQNQRINR